MNRRFLYIIIFILALIPLTYLPGFNAVKIAHAYDIPMVRVGLEYKYKNAASISVDNTEIVIGYDSGGLFTSCAELGQGPFGITATDNYYVRIPSQFQSFEQAKAYLSAYSGYNPIVGTRGSFEFYIYLSGFQTQQDAQSIGAATGGTVISLASRGVILSASGQAILLFDNETLFPQIRAKGNNGLVDLGDRQYRGAIELFRIPGTTGKITAVNICSIDEYLHSVVPSEMPASWHIEALKAQTVASRSYALTRLHAHKSDGYNFCDSGDCQVYLGASAENELSSRAVYETSGIIAMYNSEPINAVFFSSSGGWTESSENVWNDSIPYLRGVNDTIEKESKTWTRTFTLSEITNLLIAKNASIGNAVSVSITTAPASGRVAELTIHGTSGNVSYRKEEIRSFFSSSSDGWLLSRNFTITDGATYAAPAQTGLETIFRVQGKTQQADMNLQGTYVYNSGMSVSMSANTSIAVIGKNGVATYQNHPSNPSQTGGAHVSGGQSGQVTFSGRGSGHGVGMSQYGAKAMAESGQTFLDILKKYYTGVYFSHE